MVIPGVTLGVSSGYFICSSNLFKYIQSMNVHEFIELFSGVNNLVKLEFKFIKPLQGTCYFKQF